MSAYTLTSTKGKTAHDTLSDAILALGQEPHASAGFSVTFDGPHGTCEIDVLDDVGQDGKCGISGDAGAMILETAGIDPRTTDDDGFFWDYAVTVETVANAAVKFAYRSGDSKLKTYAVLIDSLEHTTRCENEHEAALDHLVKNIGISTVFEIVSIEYNTDDDYRMECSQLIDLQMLRKSGNNKYLTVYEVSSDEANAINEWHESGSHADRFPSLKNAPIKLSDYDIQQYLDKHPEKLDYYHDMLELNKEQSVPPAPAKKSASPSM